MSDDLLAKLEADGEERVRQNLAKGVYGTAGHKRPQVEAWLQMKAQARIDFSQSLQADAASRAVAAAERAAAAAERQAVAADRAATMAKIANVIATIALIVAAIALLKP